MVNGPFRTLLDIGERLRQARIAYRITQDRDDAISVEIA